MAGFSAHCANCKRPLLLFQEIPATRTIQGAQVWDIKFENTIQFSRITAATRNIQRYKWLVTCPCGNKALGVLHAVEITPGVLSSVRAIWWKARVNVSYWPSPV